MTIRPMLASGSSLSSASLSDARFLPQEASAAQNLHHLHRLAVTCPAGFSNFQRVPRPDLSPTPKSQAHTQKGRGRAMPRDETSDTFCRQPTRPRRARRHQQTRCGACSHSCLATPPQLPPNLPHAMRQKRRVKTDPGLVKTKWRCSTRGARFFAAAAVLLLAPAALVWQHLNILIRNAGFLRIPVLELHGVLL